MRRILALLVLSATMPLMAAETAEACSCILPGPPCQAAWESPVVFAGTVIQLDQAPGAFSPTRVRFRITEAFRGAEKGEIDILLNGGGGGSCDPPFKLGESWLVYANNRWQGGPGWTASACSRTRLLQSAAEDLQYLRLPDDQKPPSHIAGQVSRYVYDAAPEKQGRNVGIAGVPVTITGSGIRRETKTDDDGRYFVALEARQAYQVDFGPVEGLVIRGSGQQVWLPHHRACAAVRAGVAYEGKVAGQIVDAAGFPVSFLPVSLASSPRYLLRHTLTNVAGRFEIDVVYPGPHVLTPGTDLWPAAQTMTLTPAPLTVPAAGRVDAGRLIVPPSIKFVLVEILIEDSEGNPATDANVSFRQPDLYTSNSYEPSPRADDKGSFLISLPAGRRYEVSAQYSRKTATGTVFEEGAIVFEVGPKPIRMRLAPFR